MVKNGGADSDDPKLTYGYDWFGNVTSISNVGQPSDSQTFKYDSLNRLVNVTGLYAQTFSYTDTGNLSQRGNQSYSYSGTQRHAVTKLGVDGSATRFGYDQMGNLITRGSQSLVYDAEGRLTTVRWGTSDLEAYRYDGDGALVRRTLTPLSAQALHSQDFSSQGAGWTSAASGSGSVTWNHNPQDNSGHTSTVKLTGNGTDWTTHTYRNGYVSDTQQARVAFKLSQTGSGASLALEAWRGADYYRLGVYETGGRLAAQVHVPGQGYVTVGTLLEGLQVNVWYVLELAVDDAAGMRASVWQESESGTRYELHTELPRGLSWRFHTWIKSGTVWLDGNNTTGYAYQEERASGTATARATHLVGKHYEDTPAFSIRVKRYYAGGTLLATRQTNYGPVPGTEVTYVQGDHLGSTSTLTNWTGAVVGRERYSAFGERRRSDNMALTDQLYTGQRLNVLSGLYHYSDGSSAGRFYDPLLGRFVQADSITPGNTSIALNRYAYANNSPVRYNDPNGQACVDMADGSGIGAGAMWAVGRAGGLALRAWVISQIANALPSATANVDKAPGILQAVQQNGENAQRAAQSNGGETGDPGGWNFKDPSKRIGSRLLESTGRPSTKYQRLVTGKNYEEGWRLSSGEDVYLDAISEGMVVEAKWAGQSANAFNASPYHPASRFYDLPKTLDQLSRQVQFAQEQGLRGVRWAFSNEVAANHYRAVFMEKYPDLMNSGFLQVLHVPGTGME